MSRAYDGPVRLDPTLAMLAVFVIACVFLVAAMALAARRPRGADEATRALARRYVIGSVVCVAIGLLLALPPVVWLLLSLMSP